MRRHLLAHGFVKGGNPKDGCCPRCDCADNELWVNPQFAERKAARATDYPMARYERGTGVRCPDPEPWR